MLDEVVGRRYGPIEVSLSAAKVAEYVAATTDDAERWTQHAPPAYAGALLFYVAPAFLDDPDVAPHASMVIHGEQTFEWHQPFTIGIDLQLSGVLERVRERGGVAFANFALTAQCERGPVLTAQSTFLMSGGAAPGGDTHERDEPAPHERDTCEIPHVLADPPDSIPVLHKSASRADLVRYAGASGDFNPVHWDHSVAAGAGVGGVVVHGLLASAWATQAAARLIEGIHPLQAARVRFRAPLFPATGAAVACTRRERGLTVVVGSSGAEHVVAHIELNRE